MGHRSAVLLGHYSNSTPVLVLRVTNTTGCPSDVCTAVEDTRPVMDRNTDGQDGSYAEGTTKWPAEENSPQGKPSTKKSQSSKGKNIILRACMILKTISSLPAHRQRLTPLSPCL